MREMREKWSGEGEAEQMGYKYTYLLNYQQSSV